jgi:hypothetical protein
MTDQEETVVMREASGNFYLLVDDKLILRSTSKRIVEHYYTQMTSDVWEGPRVITPLPYDTYSKQE